MPRQISRSGPILLRIGRPLLMALTVGCVPAAARQGLQPVGQHLADRGASVPTWGPADSAVVSHGPLPVGDLSADSAIRLTLTRSPHVRAVLSSVGLAAADLWQASRLPNPSVNLSGGLAVGGGPGIASIGVGFPIVSALQRPLRTRVAAADLRAAEQSVADAVFGAIVRAQQAYVTVQYAQQVLELRRSVAATTMASAGAARAIRDAGNLPDVAVAGEEALAAQSLSDVAPAEGELAVARAELGRLLGASVADTLWTVTTALRELPTESWSMARLDSLALARRLDVAAARERALAAFSALGLANRFRLLPDGSIGALFEHEPDGRFVGPTAGIVLPIFDGGSAAVAKARASLRVRTAEHDALIVDAHADVRAAWATLDAARRRAEQLRSAVLPARRRVLQETLLQVNAMAMPVFMLLSAKQAEIDAGRAYLESLRDYWMARSELERATGGVLPTGSGT